MHAAMGAAPVKHGPQEAKAPRLYDGQRNHDDFYPLSSDAVFGISRLTTASSCSIFCCLFCFMQRSTRQEIGVYFIDKGYVSQPLFDSLLERGLHLLTRLKKNMKNKR